jgi:hypothetical protein
LSIDNFKLKERQYWLSISTRIHCASPHPRGNHHQEFRNIEELTKGKAHGERTKLFYSISEFHSKFGIKRKHSVKRCNSRLKVNINHY